MSQPINNYPFGGTETGGTIRTAVIYMSSGTAKLQGLAGQDADNDNWVDVPDSSVTASTVYTFYAAPGIQYRWVLTGDAVVEQSH